MAERGVASEYRATAVGGCPAYSDTVLSGCRARTRGRGRADVPPAPSRSQWRRRRAGWGWCRISTSASVTAEKSPRSRAARRRTTISAHTAHPFAGCGEACGSASCTGSPIVVLGSLTPAASRAESLSQAIDPRARPRPGPAGLPGAEHHPSTRPHVLQEADGRPARATCTRTGSRRDRSRRRERVRVRRIPPGPTGRPPRRGPPAGSRTPNSTRWTVTTVRPPAGRTASISSPIRANPRRSQPISSGVSRSPERSPGGRWRTGAVSSHVLSPTRTLPGTGAVIGVGPAVRSMAMPQVGPRSRYEVVRTGALCPGHPHRVGDPRPYEGVAM